MDKLLELASNIEVMDVGAAFIAPDEIPPYEALIERGIARLHAFDGDVRQTRKITERYGASARICSDFLFDGTKQTVYVAHPDSGMTSLLKPRDEALKFFNGFEQFGAVNSTESVDTKRLDDLDSVPNIDMLKMDIQGAELTVLKNGVKKLSNCVAVQLEVPYVCLYHDQPTFGEIDVWMRDHGYVPHCFVDVKRWSIAPTVRNNDFRSPFNQLLESDIVYIKDPLTSKNWEAEELKKLAVISHYCFQSVDLCVYLIIELANRGALHSDAPDEYCRMLNSTNAFRA